MTTRVLKGVAFPEANTVLAAAPGDEDDVYDLPICRLSDGTLVSCWEVDDDTLIDIAQTRRIYMHVYGKTHPPLLLATGLFDEDEKGGE